MQILTPLLAASNQDLYCLQIYLAYIKWVKYMTGIAGSMTLDKHLSSEYA